MYFACLYVGIANFDENKKIGIRNSKLNIFGIRPNSENIFIFFMSIQIIKITYLE